MNKECQTCQHQASAVTERRGYVELSGSVDINTISSTNIMVLSKLPTDIANILYQNTPEFTIYINTVIMRSKWENFLENVDTHRSTLGRGVNAQTKRRQSHVNAGTVPERENART